MKKALYRKYRPTKLSDVIGQDGTVQSLEKILKTDHIPHALLFAGPRGTGKTSIARIFAHAVNNFDYTIEDDYVDIIEIDAASNTGVDNIRDLREKVAIAPTKGRYKIYIIDEIHMLSKSAFNALLKTLEEPPAHVIFIMATTDPDDVPITIRSRAQSFTFKLADRDIMKPHLTSVAEQEGIKITPDAIDIIVKRGGGSFRDSLSLLDQISLLSDQEITAELITSALGLPKDELIKSLLSAYQSTNAEDITTHLRDLISTGIKPEIIAETALNLIIEHPTPPLIPLLATLPTVQKPFSEAKLLLAFLENQASATPPSSSPSSISRPTPASTIPTTPPASIVPSAPANPTPSTPFDWQSFLSAVKSTSSSIFSQLQHTRYDFSDNTLHLYPEKSIQKIILSSSKNRQVLIKHLGSAQLIIHDDKAPSNPPSSPQISQISDIMGSVQEVNIDKSSIPF